ncbi:4-hydroxy-tetrahydrodipicolinate reductase [Fluviispira multicolorata]|uniref:4-hydroxy-tetrahydrodipicolinate reductase n=1 Tax=Fluviispira multicolorata TaxID=2654512 RepID=A0A833JAG1_9BACT|nr:dihydrodipicolinate reductase C-terminal domain-containing protein [Fluviispira multicolorata]KAB8027961.1 hypothetical protein GCL57_12975 [Fluviispira multicolorata]
MFIGIIGASGRLGLLTCELLEQEKTSFVKILRSDLSSIENFKQLLIDIPQDLLLLDISLPQGTFNLCNIISELDKDYLTRIRGLVVGTTGHSQVQKEVLQKVSEKIPICLVSNFSKGIFLFEELLKAQTTLGLSVSDLAQKLGFDLAVHESHHTQKKDSPSGTALTLADAASIKHERISSLRVGKVIGEHTLVMSSHSENLQITHTAYTRKLFAEGALEICRNIYKNRPKPGFLRKEDFFIQMT